MGNILVEERMEKMEGGTISGITYFSIPIVFSSKILFLDVSIFHRLYLAW